MNSKQKIWFALKYLVISILAICQLLPLVLVLFNSLRTDTAIKTNPIALPEGLHLENYSQTWQSGAYGRAFLNSLVVALAVILVVLLLASACAYALAKLEFKLNGFLIAYFLVAIALPSFLYIVPVYYSFSKLHLTNTLLGLIIIYVAGNLPFNILLIRTFMVGIPKEVIEATFVDGCGEMQVFIRMIIPLSRTILMTVALLVFLSTWNEFMWANTFLTDEAIRTVATRFVKFTSQYAQDLSKIYTASVITLMPVVGLFLVFQKNFINGLTSGGVKG